ncbi:hypothetical protein SAMN05421813_11750 [Daejeonella rubra]|uniref:Uncharacterized protein n=1 Tax=Daejeonella rubra TaxID=990371 RepID=A0A1G9UQN9_9SPHI|nr:hypothetical protein SAMN05421813_11750 [Daejeonella rubra]
MDIRAQLRELSIQPLTHQLLGNLLKDYKRPNDKIFSFKSDGPIERFKKGLYISDRLSAPNDLKAHCSPTIFSDQAPFNRKYACTLRVNSREGIALTSMTTKASRKFQTSIRLYNYTTCHRLFMHSVLLP